MNRKLSLFLASLALGLASIGVEAPWVTAQQVVDVTPGINSRKVSPETSISGVFENTENESVKSGSIEIYLNGRDITGQSTITRNFFSYRPTQPLAPGDYTVRVDYQSSTGQLRSVSWMFNVQPEVAVAISQVTHNASEGLGIGGTLVVTVNGTRGSQAAVVLVENGQVVREIQAQESSPGVYTATLPVNRNGNLQDGIVIGRLTRQQRTVYGAAPRPAIFTSSQASAAPQTNNPTATSESTAAEPSEAVKLVAPQVTSHEDGDRIEGRGFTLVGTTTPNAKVRATVTASTPIFGVISLESTALVDTEVIADDEGQFEVKVPSPTILQKDTRYSVKLTSTLKDKTSKTTELELRQR